MIGDRDNVLAGERSRALMADLAGDLAGDFAGDFAEYLAGDLAGDRIGDRTGDSVLKCIDADLVKKQVGV